MVTLTAAIRKGSPSSTRSNLSICIKVDWLNEKATPTVLVVVILMFYGDGVPIILYTSRFFCFYHQQLNDTMWYKMYNLCWKAA